MGVRPSVRCQAKGARSPLRRVKYINTIVKSLDTAMYILGPMARQESTYAAPHRERRRCVRGCDDFATTDGDRPSKRDVHIVHTSARAGPSTCRVSLDLRPV